MEFTSALIVFCAAFLVLVAERIFPNVNLPKVKNWYLRAFIFNGFQVVSAFGGVYLWDWFFQMHHFADLSQENIFLQVAAGYLLITFIYYWWHRARHQVKFLWKHVHQLHHSPARIEVIASFYKHPTEIVLNGMLSSFILYTLSGLSAYAVALTVLATALAELVYHMNIKTPYLMGYFFQRPEMHRLHHKRSVHHYNYADLPIWDMLFGTFKNPKEPIRETGFPDDGENRIWDILKGKYIKF